MKQIISFIVQAVGFLASILTLTAFAYGQNWQVPTLSGFGIFDWELWTGLLGAYFLGTVLAVYNHYKGEGAEWALVGISTPVYLLWWRAFFFTQSDLARSLSLVLVLSIPAYIVVLLFAAIMEEILY